MVGVRGVQGGCGVGAAAQTGPAASAAAAAGDPGAAVAACWLWKGRMRDGRRMGVSLGRGSTAAPAEGGGCRS
eukprot:1161839-Pelagomonas_calceolata.AAC.1